MLIRKNKFQDAINNSENLETKVSELLTHVYKEEVESRKLYFRVFFLEYANEVVLIISLLAQKDPMKTPYSLFLAADIENPNQSEETKSKLLDIASLYIDQFFKKKEWDEYLDLWQENTDKKFKYFFKITRENLDISLEADRLLGES